MYTTVALKLESLPKLGVQFGKNLCLKIKPHISDMFLTDENISILVNDR